MLWDEIKKLRIKAGLKQKELAAKIGCSPVRISQIEMPPEQGGHLPSVDLIKKLVSVLVQEEEERKKLELKLLFEKTKLEAPKKVVEHFFPDEQKETFILSESGMPDAFIKRVKDDMDKTMLKESVKEKTGLDDKKLDAFLQGRYTLPRQTVIALAMAMGQPVEEYLLLANYIPENLKKLIKNHALSNVFRSLSEMSAEDISDMINVISTTIEIIKKRGKER